MPLKPFFRKHDHWWVAQLRQGSRRWQHKLVKGSPPHGSDTKQQAYALFNQLVADGTDSLPAPSKIRMSELLKAFLNFSAAHHKKNTFEWYKFFLVSFDELYGSLRPHQVTSEVVDAWLKAENGWKGSRRGAVMALKRVMNWALDNRRITHHNLRSVKVPPSGRRERFLTQEERRTLFEHYPVGDPFRDFLFAMEQTGCRPGEVAVVTAADVDLRTGVWTLSDHKTATKTGDNRVVILTEAMIELSRQLMERRPLGPLFRNADGDAWSTNAIRCRFRRARKTLKLGGDVVAYLYRHAVCTDLLESGVGLVQTCEILGHKGTTMVMRHYNKIRTRRDHLREQITKARKSSEKPSEPK
jgi:integrase